MTSDGLDHHFSLSNIPFGIASVDQDDIKHTPQCVTRIHDKVVFLDLLSSANVFNSIHNLATVFQQSTLNDFAELPKDVHRAVRKTLQDLFRRSDAVASLPRGAVLPAQIVKQHLPFRITDFTDFSVSLEHNYRAGEMILGKRFLAPGFLHFPLGYAGRASSILVSGTPIKRPLGQFVASRNEEGEAEVVMAPSKALDYELEVGVIVGKPVPHGARLMAADADDHIFGFVLVNDWSARDIQSLEMMPLGPMNGKNFATSMSPWVVTLDALEPFRVSNSIPQKPLASYLEDDGKGSYDISLQVEVIVGGASTVTCRSTTKDSLYWNPRQLLAHQAIGGCGLASGDLLATGTVSGMAEDARGCLLETTWAGKKPMTMAGGGKRGYLEDGDVVRFTALAGKIDGDDSVGFGECVGELTTADPL